MWVKLEDRYGYSQLTLYRHIKTYSNGPLYSSMVIGTLVVDGTARRGLGGL